MFGTLVYFDAQIYQAAPPDPAAVTTSTGQTRLDISISERTRSTAKQYILRCIDLCGDVIRATSIGMILHHQPAM
jgi:hypothetical protein